MALLKEKILENGVTVDYHRIVTLTCVVNSQNIIEVASYTSEAKREEEKDSNGEPINVFINTQYFNADYDEDMSVKSAYEYLKTLDEFNNSKDV